MEIWLSCGVAEEDQGYDGLNAHSMWISNFLTVRHMYYLLQLSPRISFVNHHIRRISNGSNRHILRILNGLIRIVRILNCYIPS